ncbi:MAG: LytR/AlgR family response regulator transcription factor, partial [Calditrichia bacterium]
MIRAIIVEDEQPAADRLMNFLKKEGDVKVVGIYASGKEAAEQIDAITPDLVFLDIHLSDISGIDLLRLISHKPAIIFTTAYDQYAIQAFELRAVDYLLKPYSEERLNEAVERVREHLAGKENPMQQIQDLLVHWQPKQP